MPRVPSRDVGLLLSYVRLRWYAWLTLGTGAHKLGFVRMVVRRAFRYWLRPARDSRLPRQNGWQPSIVRGSRNEASARAPKANLRPQALSLDLNATVRPGPARFAPFHIAANPTSTAFHVAPLIERPRPDMWPDATCRCQSLILARTATREAVTFPHRACNHSCVPCSIIRPPYQRRLRRPSVLSDHRRTIDCACQPSDPTTMSALPQIQFWQLAWPRPATCLHHRS